LVTRDAGLKNGEQRFNLIAGKNAPAPGGTATPGYTWRLVAEALARHPQPWGAPLLLTMLGRAPEADTQLVYALRLAFKNHALQVDAPTLAAWAAASPGDAGRIVEGCLALTTPAAARFLAARVRDAKTPDLRIGEFARHVALNLPKEEFASFAALLEPLSAASALQRLMAAEGLATIAAQPQRVLPDDVAAWMRRELFAALEDKAALAVRAANALKPLALPEKGAPLRRRALATNAAESVRAAALRALTPGEPETAVTAIAVLVSAAPLGARRAAAEVLGLSRLSSAGLAALSGAFEGAPADFALTLATTLATSDQGAAELLELAVAGRVRLALLRHRYVALALEKRPAALRERAAALTKALPPEDARLDALVAYRVGALGSFKPDRTNGAAVFAAHCAACHRFRDAGGNLGPSLDGIGARALPRLVEDILDPSRNVDPTFRLTTLTLKNGETKSGMNFREEAGRVLLRDPNSGEEVAVAKADVAETAPAAISPMPAAFETALKEQEFFDLVDFLRSEVK
jgi:putative heme-binding domain-containing protein